LRPGLILIVPDFHTETISNFETLNCYILCTSCYFQSLTILLIWCYNFIFIIVIIPMSSLKHKSVQKVWLTMNMILINSPFCTRSQIMIKIGYSLWTDGMSKLNYITKSNCIKRWIFSSLSDINYQITK
jgi:hypothetical protein